MFKNNLFEKLYNSKKVDRYFLLLILFTILFKFITFEHYAESDEIASIALLSSFKTSLIKFWGHNHFLTTQIGNLIIYIFGVDIMKLRLLSLTCFIIMILLIQRYFKDYSKTFAFIFICLSINMIISYFSIYRGYAISSLLFTLVFFLIDFKKNNLENSRLLYLILALLIIHNESTLFLIIPILLVFNFEYLKNTNKFIFKAYKNLFLFFIIPFLSLLLMFSFTEGLYLKKIFINASNYMSIFPFIFNNFFNIISVGFFKLIFNEANSVSLFSNLDDSYILVKKDPYLFLIFVISLLKSIYFIFFKKDKDIIHLIIFIFFITFLLINRNGPTRIYTGFISFFIIYLLRDFNLDLIKNRFFNFKLFNIIIVLLIFIKLYSIEFPNVDTEKQSYITLKENLVNCDFPSDDHTEPPPAANKKRFERLLEYFVYLQECKKKPDINKFYKYYKS